VWFLRLRDIPVTVDRETASEVVMSSILLHPPSTAQLIITSVSLPDFQHQPLRNSRIGLAPVPVGFVISTTIRLNSFAEEARSVNGDATEGVRAMRIQSLEQSINWRL